MSLCIRRFVYLYLTTCIFDLVSLMSLNIWDTTFKQDFATSCAQPATDTRNHPSTREPQNVHSNILLCWGDASKTGTAFTRIIAPLAAKLDYPPQWLQSSTPSSTPNLILERCHFENLGTLPELLHHLAWPNADGSCVFQFRSNVKFGG